MTAFSQEETAGMTRKRIFRQPLRVGKTIPLCANPFSLFLELHRKLESWMDLILAQTFSKFFRDFH
jgi:hypothetical protein